MSGKSRHGKGKGPQSSKKKRNIRRSQQAVAQQPQPQATKSVSETLVETPAAAPSATVPVAAREPLMVATVTASYPNLPYELRRIGILAAVMLAVLIVLSLLLG
jgi:hypothetical protein